jgi:hypothetical protein
MPKPGMIQCSRTHSAGIEYSVCGVMVLETEKSFCFIDESRFRVNTHAICSSQSALNACSFFLRYTCSVCKFFFLSVSSIPGPEVWLGTAREEKSYCHEDETSGTLFGLEVRVCKIKYNVLRARFEQFVIDCEAFRSMKADSIFFHVEPVREGAV